MSWQVYVDDHLMCEIEGQHLTSAAIIGHDGSIWAASEGFPQVVSRFNPSFIEYFVWIRSVRLIWFGISSFVKLARSRRSEGVLLVLVLDLLELDRGQIVQTFPLLLFIIRLTLFEVQRLICIKDIN